MAIARGSSSSAGLRRASGVTSRRTGWGRTVSRAPAASTSTERPLPGSRRLLPLSHRAVSSAVRPPTHTRTASSSPPTPWLAAARNTTVSSK